MSHQREEFSNRWGIILASLGMAIGAGNLWRFPRLAGQYGGSFILLWILFLLVWSIPLLLAEFSIGKKFKSGVIGSFGQLTGSRFAWMGFFITVCTLGIAFYYSIVTAWAVEYLGISIHDFYVEIVHGQSVIDRLNEQPNMLLDQWSDLSNNSWITVCTYIGIVIFGVYVVTKGVKAGLEKANRILIPSLFVLLIIVAATALSMDGGVKGLQYMFQINWSSFKDPTIWIEALSQSAWSTGAGWGLLMTISSYSRTDEDVTLNTFIGAFGNNTASIIAGMAILPAVFALSATDQEAISFLQRGSQALTFTIIPKLFGLIPGGGFMSVLFFAALTLAAFSSFLPMVDLLRSNLIVFGLKKKVIGIILLLAFILFGLPSALSLSFFSNQDWVWGLGLIISGVFIAIATVKYGPLKFKKEMIDGDSDFFVSGRLFQVCIYLVLWMGPLLIYWWMAQGYSSNTWFSEDGKWNWIDTYSNASILTQWSIVILIGVLINRYLYKKFCEK